MTNYGFERDNIEKTRIRSRTSSSSGSSTTSSTTNSSSSTSTTIHTHPGVFRISNEIMELIVSEFEENLNQTMNAVIGRKIAEYMEHYDISVQVVIEAIHDTALAARPTARYLLAILDRCAEDEICTLDDWQREKSEYEYKRSRRMRMKYLDGPVF